jgi:hypothetical protein
LYSETASQHLPDIRKLSSHSRPLRLTELDWDGKYKDGKNDGPVRIALAFQTIETAQERGGLHE